jgi:hypothetical protein
MALITHQPAVTPISLHVVQTASPPPGLALNPEIIFSTNMCLAWRQRHTKYWGWDKQQLIFTPPLPSRMWITSWEGTLQPEGEWRSHCSVHWVPGIPKSQCPFLSLWCVGDGLCSGCDPSPSPQPNYRTTLACQRILDSKWYRLEYIAG